jgi:hypothetical protein
MENPNQTNTTVETTSEIVDKFINDLKEHNQRGKELLTSVKMIRTEVLHLQKAAQKKVKRVRSENSKPTGFEQKVGISKNLATLLDVSEDTLMSRREANKLIYNYIDTNGLKVEDNKRVIKPDDKLMSIFNLNATYVDPNTGKTGNVFKDKGVNIYTMQTLIKDNFVKLDTGATATTTATEVTTPVTKKVTPKTSTTKTVKTKKTTTRQAVATA